MDGTAFLFLTNQLRDINRRRLRFSVYISSFTLFHLFLSQQPSKSPLEFNHDLHLQPGQVSADSSIFFCDLTYIWRESRLEISSIYPTLSPSASQRCEFHFPIAANIRADTTRFLRILQSISSRLSSLRSYIYSSQIGLFFVSLSSFQACCANDESE